ncbi:hypothetical protein UlMin_023714, partial [Ulmus minor]
MNIYTLTEVVLGNHDYRGNVLAQLSHVLTKFDSRWLYLRSFVLNTEIVDFFFVDTNPFVMHFVQAHNVNFYVNGHDHCLEHIIDSK